MKNMQLSTAYLLSISISPEKLILEIRVLAVRLYLERPLRHCRAPPLRDYYGFSYFIYFSHHLFSPMNF